MRVSNISNFDTNKKLIEQTKTLLKTLSNSKKLLHLRYIRNVMLRTSIDVIQYDIIKQIIVDNSEVLFNEKIICDIDLGRKKNVKRCYNLM